LIGSAEGTVDSEQVEGLRNRIRALESEVDALKRAVPRLKDVNEFNVNGMVGRACSND